MTVYRVGPLDENELPALGAGTVPDAAFATVPDQQRTTLRRRALLYDRAAMQVGLDLEPRAAAEAGAVDL